jgi:Methyltransferase domain
MSDGGMTLTNALGISGWMAPSELEWLAERASRCSCLVEVGSWLGRSTRALAENTTGLVFAVDTWRGSAEHQEQIDREFPGDLLFAQFTSNVSGLSNVSILRAASLEAAALLAEAGIQPQMVFIDASHAYEDVCADILAWKPVVAPGGLLCGHDYCWDSVKQAVSELLPNAEGFAPEGWDEATIWYTRN